MFVSLLSKMLCFGILFEDLVARTRLDYLKKKKHV